MKKVFVSPLAILILFVCTAFMKAPAAAIDVNPYLPTGLSFMPNIPLPDGEVFAETAWDGLYL